MQHQYRFETVLYLHISDGSDAEIGFLGAQNHLKNGFKQGTKSLRQVERDFSSFFDKFLAYLMIFQSFTAPSVLQ